MKKQFVLAAVIFTLLSATAARADMAVYVNGGVSNMNPTIGLNAEFQYGYASVALGAGVMAYNDFGIGAGLRGYLFGIDAGPYLEFIYGTSGERANTHTDSSENVVVDSIDVFYGISVLAGWRLFFGEGWNMTFGAGASEAGGKGLFVFNVTAGVMVWGDEAAEKNADKYRKSYEPPEPGDEYIEPEMPDEGETPDEDVIQSEMMEGPESETSTNGADTEILPDVTETSEPAEITGTAVPAGVTGTAGGK